MPILRVSGCAQLRLAPPTGRACCVDIACWVQAQQQAAASRSSRISVVPLPQVEESIPSIYEGVINFNLRREWPALPDRPGPVPSHLVCCSKESTCSLQSLALCRLGDFTECSLCDVALSGGRPVLIWCCPGVQCWPKQIYWTVITLPSSYICWKLTARPPATRCALAHADAPISGRPLQQSRVLMRHVRGSVAAAIMVQYLHDSRCCPCPSHSLSVHSSTTIIRRHQTQLHGCQEACVTHCRRVLLQHGADHHGAMLTCCRLELVDAGSNPAGRPGKQCCVYLLGILRCA